VTEPSLFDEIVDYSNRANPWPLYAPARIPHADRFDPDRTDNVHDGHKPGLTRNHLEHRPSHRRSSGATL
jgi:hypothetical protein